MSALNFGLNSALSGLLTAQQGLDSVSNNIANVNTPGYTRKVFQQQSVVLAGEGAGVYAGTVKRQVDAGLTKNLQAQGGIVNNMQALDNYYSQTQQLFGQPGDQTSISATVTKMANAFETLAVSPNDSTAQSQAVQSGIDTATQLNTLGNSIQSLRAQADNEISQDVGSCQTLVNSIANLNDEIVRDGTLSRDTTDLQDQRDQAMLKLSGYMGISSYQNGDGSLTVFTTQGATLVSGTSVSMTHSAASTINATQNEASGSFSAISAGTVDITNSLGSGKLAGLVQMRDQILPSMQSQLDQLTSQLKTTLNQVSNRGTSYPNVANNMTGTRDFINPAAQTITLGAGDVRLLAYKASDGSQQTATTTLKTLLGGAGPFTINQVAGAINTYINTAAGTAGTTYAQVTNGKMNINIPSNLGFGLAFRDENAAGTPSDMAVSFQGDGTGATTQTVNGFSNFLGLNDVMVTNTPNSMTDTNIQPSNWSWGGPAAATLNFSDGTSGLNFKSITVPAGSTLTQIAAAINNPTTGVANVTAEVIPEGAGSRLRLTQGKSQELLVSGTAALVNNLGLAPSSVGTSNIVQVNPSMVASPQSMPRGIVQSNVNTVPTSYNVSAGDNTVANQLAAVFTANQTFAAAGTMPAISQTLGAYAASVLAGNATAANNNSSNLAYQTTLNNNLTTKAANEDGVNLDQEMSQMMTYQQAYSATAKVISTIQTMFGIMTDMIR